MSETRFAFDHTVGYMRITVTPSFLEEESQPDQNRFVWAYHIRIENMGEHTIKLLRRQWVITDGRGHMKKVQGEGVVGQQPTLGPGDVFEYASSVPLTTPTGLMKGSYAMIQLDTKAHFEVETPIFSLDCPYMQCSVN